MDEYGKFLLLSLILIIIGLLVYMTIIIKNRETLSTLTLSEALIGVLSHVPSGKTTALPHIVASLFVIPGISLMLATVSLDVIHGENSNFKEVFPSAGIIMSLMFSGISVWTLWQTRRLEFMSGHHIADFLDLIYSVEQDLAEIKNHYIEADKKKELHHRVYFITTQPLFGTVTYRTNKKTTELANHLRNLIEFSTSNGISEADRFDFQLICGTEKAIDEFHQTAGLDPKVGQDVKDKIENCLSGAVNKTVFRADNVPSVQFIVIGRKVYDFVLSVGPNGSALHGAQVSKEETQVEKYCETFRIFKDLLTQTT